MIKVFIFIVIIAVIFLFTAMSVNGDEKEIRQWAKENGMEVKEIDMHITSIDSPFYYVNKGSFIYEVDMTNGEKWWVRTGIFGNDYEKQK